MASTRTRQGSGRPVAVVTGASAGVGRATAIALAEHGYDVGLLARGRAGLEGAASDVKAAGGSAAILQADVADFDAVEAAADQVERELGPIDVWINNAMTTVFGHVADVSAAEIERTTAVTYLGQVHGTMVALERMKRRGAGRIVNVGSALAFVGIPLQAAYCGAKFACRGFTESVRAELLAEGSPVTISMVHLPAMDTPQFDWCESKMDAPARPVAPIYRPETAAEAIVAAAEDGRRADVVGSWNRLIVTLASMAPGVVAHFAADTGVDSQQSDGDEDPSRASNLYEPVDDDHDVGMRGRFGDEAHGIATPEFVRSLPGVAVTLVGSVGASLGDRVRQISAHLGR
jgi:short-subunit dehydrogenase